MSQSPKNLHPSVAKSLDFWHQMVARQDLGELNTIVHPDAVFRSPVAHQAYTPAPALILALSTVIQVFKNFTYHRQLATDDGLSVVLEFSAKVNGKELKGIDMIQFDDEGKIVDFEVMVRPMSGLQALGDEMAKRLAPYLAAMKGAKA